jgi:hypothetical protein
MSMEEFFIYKALSEVETHFQVFSYFRIVRRSLGEGGSEPS